MDRLRDDHLPSILLALACQALATSVPALAATALDICSSDHADRADSNAGLQHVCPDWNEVAGHRDRPGSEKDGGEKDTIV